MNLRLPEQMKAEIPRLLKMNSRAREEAINRRRLAFCFYGFRFLPGIKQKYFFLASG